MVSPGANGHTPSSISAAIIDPNLVVRHLVDLLEITLGASTEDLESPGSLLSGSKRHDTVQRCTRFASEPQDALYVLKDVIPPNQLDSAQTAPGMFQPALTEIQS
jgi:dynein heavy chain 1, cytosolic